MASDNANADITGSSPTSTAATGALAVVEEEQPPKSEQEILNTYRRMQSEMQSLIQNLTKFEMDRNEHRYVVDIAVGLFSSFCLGVCVQQSVGILTICQTPK
jgi:uncharacterized FlaG/YvyC family protein